MGEPRFTAEQVIGFANQVTQTGGAITWDTPVQRNGLISSSFIEILHALGKAMGR
jgi:hypothetical protein